MAAVASLIILASTGCAPRGPSREEIKNALQAQLKPSLEVKSLESEFVPTGQEAGVVRIKAQLRLTEDLFVRVPQPIPLPDEERPLDLLEAIQDAQRENVVLPKDSKPAYQKAEEAFTAAVRETETPVIKTTQKLGATFPLSAKADAMKEFKEWKISSFDLERSQIEGTSRTEFPANSLMEGDPKIKEIDDAVRKSGDAREKALRKFIEDIRGAIQANRAAIAAQLQAKEEAIMGPIRNALKVGNSWSDYSSFQGMKVPLKWTITKCHLTGTSKDIKIGTITFKVESGKVSGDFSGEVYRLANSGAISMNLHIEEKPVYPDGVPGIIPFIFSPQNGVDILLADGVLTKDGWGFMAQQDGQHKH